MSSGGSRISQQLSSQDPGKGNETSISNAKVLQEETGKPASEADPQLVKPKLKYEKTIPSSNKTLVTDKPPASAARPQLAKPKHKHENPIPSTNETGVTDKPPASPTDPQVVNSKNEHEHIIPSSNKTSVTDKLTDNSNVHNHSETNANITKSNSTVDMEASHTKQNHAKGKNYSDAVTGLSTSSHNRSVKLVTGVEKHEGSLEEVTNQKSEITAVPVSENKASAVETPSKEVQNKNDDEHALPTEKKYNKSQNTDSAYNVPNDDDHEESEDIVNIDTPGNILFVFILDIFLHIYRETELMNICSVPYLLLYQNSIHRGADKSLAFPISPTYTNTTFVT
jgi:hypothetical protein